MAGTDLDAALQLLTAALQELDQHHAPGEIGASVDLAICQLKAFMSGHDAEGVICTRLGRVANADFSH